MSKEKKPVNTEIMSKVEVLPGEAWREISLGWAVSDPRSIFTFSWECPMYINGAFHAAEDVRRICSQLVQTTGDDPLFGALYEELVQAVGVVSAEWFWSTWLDRLHTITREDRKERAREWMNRPDVIKIIDAIKVEYDPMYSELWRFEEHQGNAAFAYGYLIGLAAAENK